MRIAITTDPEIPVPPLFYGGIERIVDLLVHRLSIVGHEVTLFAHEDSKVLSKFVPWKGKTSRKKLDIIKNTFSLLVSQLNERYEVVHSFSRLAYLIPLMPGNVVKIMSYQREPSLSQIKMAYRLSKTGTLSFTGCSNYITDKIKPFARANTIYNCVSIDYYTFKNEIEWNAPLVFLGRIESIKGAHLAIEVAMKTDKDLIIAGNVPAEGKEYFNHKIKPFLNNRIQYIGPVNDKQKNELLGQAAAFLMPIQWNEPFGIVMAEAMACGTPVIGLNAGAVPEVVEHGVTGFICKDVNEMISSVHQIHTLKRSDVRKSAETRFSEKVITDQYLDLYYSLLQN